ALRRMQREGNRIDRQVGSELALREGAKALVLPTVALVGGRARVTLELVDPASGVTVFTQMADSAGGSGVLRAMDEVMIGIRNDLGESLSSIDESSSPLEQVTSSNLEALRAFSLGVRARLADKPLDAMRYFENAVLLDPEFSMAYQRMAFVRYSEGN